jgi:hypothetical protein
VDWADLDRDGRLELVVAQSNGPVKVYGGPSLEPLPVVFGPFTSINGNVFGVRSFDADNDGDLEVVATNQNGASPLFSAFVPPLVQDIKPLVVPPGDSDWRTGSLAWGNIDGDNDLDLLVGASNGEFGSWLYKNEDGEFGAPKTIFSGPGPQDVVFANANKDSTLEASISMVNELQLYPNAGGSLQSPSWSFSLQTTTEKRSLAWADADDDGDLDLLMGQPGQKSQVFRNEGDTPLALHSFYSTTQVANTRSVAWFDYVRGADPDLS